MGIRSLFNIWYIWTHIEISKLTVKLNFSQLPMHLRARRGWKCLVEWNALAYYINSSITAKKDL